MSEAGHHHKASRRAAAEFIERCFEGRQPAGERGTTAATPAVNLDFTETAFLSLTAATGWFQPPPHLRTQWISYL